MTKKLKKLKRNLELVFHSLFYGMKGANDVVFKTEDLNNGSTITANVELGGVFQDMLQQKETQQVKETRDSYYRVLREADKYHVDVKMSLDENEEITKDLVASSRKKTLSDYIKHPTVDESDGYKPRVIQDNVHIQKYSNFDPSAFSNKSLMDYETLLTINRGDFRPNILIEKFTTRIVVKNIDENNAVIDLYLPTEPAQFNKLEAIVIANLNRLFQTKNKRDPMLVCESIEFISDKAWNAENLQLFKYDNIVFKEEVVFDGHFVLRFHGHIVSDGESIDDKFKTKELDKKYEEKAPKKEATNIFAIERQINNEITSLDSTTLKI